MIFGFRFLYWFRHHFCEGAANTPPDTTPFFHRPRRARRSYYKPTDPMSAGATDTPVDQSFTSISSDVSVLSWNILAGCYFQRERSYTFVTDKALLQWSQRLKVRLCFPRMHPMNCANLPYDARPLLWSHSRQKCLVPTISRRLPPLLRTRPLTNSPTRVAFPTNSRRIPPLCRTPTHAPPHTTHPPPTTEDCGRDHAQQRGRGVLAGGDVHGL